MFRRTDQRVTTAARLRMGQAPPEEHSTALMMSEE